MLCVCSARSSCPVDPGQDLDVQEPGPGGQVLEAAEKLLLQHRRSHRSHIHVQSNRGIPLASVLKPDLFILDPYPTFKSHSGFDSKIRQIFS